MVPVSCPAADAANTISCNGASGSGPAACRQVANTVAVGTVNRTC